MKFRSCVRAGRPCVSTSKNQEETGCFGVIVPYLAAFVTQNDKINGNQWRGVFAQMLETTFAGSVESGATSAVISTLAGATESEGENQENDLH